MDALVGREERALSSSAFQRREGTHQGADPGTVKIGDSSQIYRDVRGSRIHEFLDVVAKVFLRFP